MTILSGLTNVALTAELSRLAHCEREATAALIVHLAEFDARRLYEGAGFPSLFEYCRAILHLSEDAIYSRIEAARATRDYPVIAGMLVAGTVSPTTARMIRRHLTPENHAELLSAASGMGKREVEHLLASRFPQPDVAASVRKLPTRRSSDLHVLLSAPRSSPDTAPACSPAAAPPPVADFAPRTLPIVTAGIRAGRH